MGRRPERTCIGCRGVFGKDEVVRIVAGPGGAVIDYREKLPGRAAYVCARRDCIMRALSRDHLSKALRTKVRVPSPEEFSGDLAAAIRRRISSLLSLAAKAGMTAAGFSAVEDALLKGRARMLVFSEDCAEGTRQKVTVSAEGMALPVITLYTTADLGGMIGRELISAAAIIDQGFSDALESEWKRLKGLINTHA